MGGQGRKESDTFHGFLKREWDDKRPRDARDWFHLATWEWYDILDYLPKWAVLPAIVFFVAFVVAFSLL